MSNSFIMWLLTLVPWLTLFFMKKEEIKRWMPVAMFAVVLATIIGDIGIRLGVWATREPTFPFSQILPFFYGVMPVLTIWVFKFTYRHFWPYMITNLILDVVFNFFILGYFLPGRGIVDFNISPLLSLPITLLHAVVIYGYQMWQDEALLNTDSFTKYNIKPAVAKLFTNNSKDDESD
ncbi:MAG TPA: hypothetical protein PKA28_06490 [Methylomusa anaerophila]|uniref:Uncharacterized protein n=1 Tax=Methylomusa anaerophila TaxID=1930071 RepID=A0A348AGJ3_9FIRM|nr:hypothetical protein [Methylomusa anaerophila]BBB90191.1 hypothetical protein MAMMFC1_00839 [Methylomusa anaerophila]HML88083.1 hypothetical protein [Methylomusa anaerophila]